MVRQQVLRAAAVGLIVYGLFGFVLVALGFTIARTTFDEVGLLRRSLDAQRTGLVGSLRATAATLGTISTAFDNVESTLAEARESSRQASELARGMSRTMGGLAGAAQVQILGLAPFGQLGEGFGQAADQMRQLGDDLDRMGSALGKNAGDLGTVRASLTEMRRHVDILAGAFDAMPMVGTAHAEMHPFRLAIYGLLVWLAGQALVSVLLGAVLFERAQARLREARLALPPPDLPAEQRSIERDAA